MILQCPFWASMWRKQKHLLEKVPAPRVQHHLWQPRHGNSPSVQLWVSGQRNCGIQTHGLPRSPRKASQPAICNSVDGPQGHRAECEKDTSDRDKRPMISSTCGIQARRLERADSRPLEAEGKEREKGVNCFGFGLITLNLFNANKNSNVPLLPVRLAKMKSLDAQSWLGVGRLARSMLLVSMEIEDSSSENILVNTHRSCKADLLLSHWH